MGFVLLLIVVVVVVAAVLLRSRGGGSGNAEDALVRLCFGDRSQAERLIKEEQRRTPGISRPGAAARAARRLKRDRAR